MPDTLQTHLCGEGVLTIKLNRPDIRNAFNAKVISELQTAFLDASTNESVRLVLLKGEGPVFCAGGDLNWMRDAVEKSREENYKDTRTLAHMFATMNECPKPVIGLVHGAAIGGGVGLVSVCDVVVASEETVFSLSEVRLGLIPACIAPFVIPKIGVSQARRYFQSAERFTAQEAKEIGLVHKLVANPQDLDAAAASLMKGILECGPDAVRAAKKMILDLSWPGRTKPSEILEYAAGLLADLRVSPQGQEGVRAFLEKRKPTWNKSS